MKRILAALAALLLSFHAPAQQQADGAGKQDEPKKSARELREQRIREHEERIRNIIRERSEAAKKREEAARAKTEGAPVDAATPGGQAEVIGKAAESTSRRASASLLLYCNFPTAQQPRQLDTHVAVGDEFLSELILYNDQQTPVDRLRLAVTYDKRFLEPVKVFDSRLRKAAKGEPAFKLHPREGIIQYDVDLATPIASREDTILRIQWRALRATSQTQVNFSFSQAEDPAEPHTAAMAGGRNVLGIGSDPIDGVLGGGIVIQQDAKGARPLQGKKEELREMYLGAIGTHSEVGLVLMPPGEEIRVGDIFPVHVAVNNPHGTLIDSIDLMLSFDPAVLRVVDRDRGNRVRQGVNGLEGPYTADFPFDYLKWNEAWNNRGLYRYSSGISDGIAFPSRPFVTVFFEALAPAAGTEVRFLRERPGEGNLTGVRYFGFDVGSLVPPLSRPVARIPIAAAPEGYRPTDASIALLKTVAERQEAAPSGYFSLGGAAPSKEGEAAPVPAAAAEAPAAPASAPAFASRRARLETGDPVSPEDAAKLRKKLERGS
jgi:hypothetical protein